MALRRRFSGFLAVLPGFSGFEKNGDDARLKTFKNV
jgi:hypothetical protein